MINDHLQLKEVFPNAVFFKVNSEDKFFGACHDTRHLLSKEIFVCLKGSNNHGVDYAQRGIEKGALAILVDHEHHQLFDGPKIIVQDVEIALKNAVKKVRGNYQSKVIAVTGSAGKTSTKEYYRQLCIDDNACISYGNWNNFLGLMINLSRLSNKTKFNFFELGISKVGEMDLLVDLLKPDIVFITSIGEAYLEGLHSCEIVATEKMKIGNFAQEKYCSEQARPWLTEEWEVVTCENVEKNIDIEHQQLETRFEFQNKNYKVFSDGFLHEKLLSFCIFILSRQQQKIESSFYISIFKGRGKFIKHKNMLIIDDTYNCNFLSLIELASNISKEEKSLMVFGDLAELGIHAAQLIKDLRIKLTHFKNLRYLYFGKMKELWVDHDILAVQSIDELHDYVNKFQSKIIAFKASRSAAIEEFMFEFMGKNE